MQKNVYALILRMDCHLFLHLEVELKS